MPLTGTACAGMQLSAPCCMAGVPVPDCWLHLTWVSKAAWQVCARLPPKDQV